MPPMPPAESPRAPDGTNAAALGCTRRARCADPRPRRRLSRPVLHAGRGAPRTRGTVMDPAPGQPNETDKERVDRELIELLNELRVALPGVQVLFAFLLIVPFQRRFTNVTAFQKEVYFVTLSSPRSRWRSSSPRRRSTASCSAPPRSRTSWSTPTASRSSGWASWPPPSSACSSSSATCCSMRERRSRSESWARPSLGGSGSWCPCAAGGPGGALSRSSSPGSRGDGPR